MVAQRNPQIKRAAVKLRELSADEKARDMFERREKGRRDVEAYADEARADERTAIARNLLNMNLPIEQIIRGTGLTRSEVEALSKTE
jgi:hypothetical protein